MMGGIIAKNARKNCFLFIMYFVCIDTLSKKKIDFHQVSNTGTEDTFPAGTLHKM